MKKYSISTTTLTKASRAGALTPVDRLPALSIRLLTIQSTSQMLSVSPSMVRRLISDGSLPFVQVRGRVLIDIVDIERFIAALKSQRECSANGDSAVTVRL